MIYSGLVSVIIPVFNAEKYLIYALNSICCQTYKNLEIICINDGSTDSTEIILRDACRQDKRIILINNENNCGIVYSLNKAVKSARGEFIARMDADDISLPDRIEKQVQYLIDNDLEFVGSPVTYITESGVAFGKSSYYNRKELIEFLCYKSTLGHPTWLLYKYVYDLNDGYRDLAPAEDYDFLLRAANADIRIGMIDIPLVKFRTQLKNGGTALINGLVQRKMFNYAKKISKNDRGYCRKEVENLRKTGSFSHKCFYYSQIYYSRSMRNRHRNSYFTAALYLITSVVLSPYQAQFVYRAVILRCKKTLSRLLERKNITD
ncbi:glycosyltransferase family 2 protein [Motiliproteus sp. MSK22-1]|uniref:glycosyltransferase family 2 protein n=1 Tax=Motiliproteus sp. MSK22-1 TaxID=1897630 RepID=UPI000977925D|nr:glycosyltransferase family 2 protein [Motiliproteus sp. MSK22-1]OMH36182.1 hypothetical protein BGP75_10240 [Motiliproteus sp. MSK22-1]